MNLGGLKMKLNEKVAVPHDCVPVLESYKVGQRVVITYDGGMGGVYDVEGEIVLIDAPDFDIQKDNGDIFSAIMADIHFITLLKSNVTKIEEYKITRKSKC
jgi:hypothetical protein